MQTPLHETSDDPRAYRQEQARVDYGRALALLLVHATGACFAREALAVDELDERERQLVHFVELARDGRAQWGARWTPSGLLLRALDRRGLSWADVEAELARAEDDDDAVADAHDERCSCSACERVRSRYARQAREREADACGGLSDVGRELLGW